MRSFAKAMEIFMDRILLAALSYFFDPITTRSNLYHKFAYHMSDANFWALAVCESVSCRGSYAKS